MASRSRRRQDFLTSLEVQADGTVAFMVRNFEGMGQCLYRGKWTADGFVGTCEP